MNEEDNTDKLAPHVVEFTSHFCSRAIHTLLVNSPINDIDETSKRKLEKETNYQLNSHKVFLFFSISWSQMI